MSRRDNKSDQRPQGAELARRLADPRRHPRVVTGARQVLSYTKMLGQLQDAGNTTTLAHYLELLTAAGMLTGLRRSTPVRPCADAPPAPSCKCSTLA